MAGESQGHRRTAGATEGVPEPGVAAKAWGWVLDYAYVVFWMIRGLVSRTTPDHFLHPPEPRSPVLLIPGVYESWQFMQPIAKHLYEAGHPVHVLDKLGFNTGAIPAMAEIVSAYLEQQDLSEVTIVAHSKGGLIGKYALADPQTLVRVRHLVAINTPFSGSRYAYLFLLRSVRMFTPRGPVIRELMRNRVVNQRITSLYSVFDPHIPETSQLPGADNVVLPAIGHFRPIADPHTLGLISAVLDRETGEPASSEDELGRGA